jgi:putative acetyltransferase
LGCGALKALGRAAGKVKAMRAVSAARGRGVGTAVLEHLIEDARRREYRALYLEIGSQDFFAPARLLYAGAGFDETSPFGSYSLDPNSVYMVLRLH